MGRAERFPGVDTRAYRAERRRRFRRGALTPELLSLIRPALLDQRMAEVTVRFWAGAARAAERDEEQVTAATVGELRSLLGARPALQKIAVVASLLVDGQAAGEATKLADGAVVDVLPPFSGG